MQQKNKILRKLSGKIPLLFLLPLLSIWGCKGSGGNSSSNPSQPGKNLTEIRTSDCEGIGTCSSETIKLCKFEPQTTSPDPTSTTLSFNLDFEMDESDNPEMLFNISTTTSAEVSLESLPMEVTFTPNACETGVVLANGILECDALRAGQEAIRTALEDQSCTLPGGGVGGVMVVVIDGLPGEDFDWTHFVYTIDIGGCSVDYVFPDMEPGPGNFPCP